MASEIRVVRWIGYDEAGGMPESVGWLGGSSRNMLWPEYVSNYGERAHPYLEAIRAEVVSRGLNTCGDEHQDSMVPVFSDGTVGTFSYRAWGDLMSAIWNTELGERRFGYMDFYMAPGPEVIGDR